MTTPPNAPKVKPILSQNAFTGDSDDPMVQRRLAVQGAASMLFYDEPLHIVRGEGCWLFDKDGKRYLDMYNNVSCLGHAHPKVIEAVHQQMSNVSIHSRYIHENLIEYSEKLLATFSHSNDLNLVMTCTGSESNDLALRIARKNFQQTRTQLIGRENPAGFVVTEAAYHGNTDLVTTISPSALKHGQLDNNIVTIPIASMPRDNLEGASNWFTRQVESALAELEQRGFSCAAIIIDSVFSSDGVFVEPSGFLQTGMDLVKKQGGLLIADEVQPGFGRTGESFWAFERHNLQPDIITLGKPMANGYPAAGVVCDKKLLASFCDDVGYFNTFGGSTVAAAAAMAVLQSLEEEQLQANALTQGQVFLSEIDNLKKQHSIVGDIRGIGLFWAIDIHCPLGNGAELTQKIVNQLCLKGVLVGATGKNGTTLKIRPPLCYIKQHNDFFFSAFDDVLTNIVC